MATETSKTGRESDKFMLRLPDGMRERLKVSAESRNRTINAEVVARLDSTFQENSPNEFSQWEAYKREAILKIRFETARVHGMAIAAGLLEVIDSLQSGLRVNPEVAATAEAQIQAAIDYVASFESGDVSRAAKELQEAVDQRREQMQTKATSSLAIAKKTKKSGTKKA